jgi:polyisoprenoid-binding protein YceI
MRQFFIVLGLISFLASIATAQSTSYGVDLNKSNLSWTGYKVLGKHYGPIQLASGTLEFSGSTLKGGDFVIDMTSIDCEDLSGGSKDKLVGHLKSEDFFGVDNHPKAMFKIKNTKKSGANTYEVTGDLTIKGITHPVTFPATVEVTGNMTKASADIKVDRTKYDIKYRSGSFFDGLGDKAINNEFDMKVSLVVNTAVK